MDTENCLCGDDHCCGVYGGLWLSPAAQWDSLLDSDGGTGEDQYRRRLDFNEIAQIEGVVDADAQSSLSWMQSRFEEKL